MWRATPRLSEWVARSRPEYSALLEEHSKQSLLGVAVFTPQNRQAVDRLVLKRAAPHPRASYFASTSSGQPPSIIAVRSEAIFMVSERTAPMTRWTGSLGAIW